MYYDILGQWNLAHIHPCVILIYPPNFSSLSLLIWLSLCEHKEGHTDRQTDRQTDRRLIMGRLPSQLYLLDLVRVV